MAVSPTALRGDEPKQGDVNKAILGGEVVLETVYIPPGEFLMGSTPEEKAWATGIEGGAKQEPNANHTKASNRGRCR